MTGRGTALLVAVLLGLVGYLWLVEARHTRRPPASAEPPPLLADGAGAAARIELYAGDARVTALRRDGGWVDGDGRPWSGTVVGDLVETLAALRPVMVIDADPEDDSAYGLGPAAQRLQVSAADGRPLLTLEVGERNPAWTALYARRAGERQVFLVGAVLRWELEKLRDAAPGN